MDSQSDDYQFGRLIAEVKHLVSAVETLSGQVTSLRIELEELKMFRSRVVGMSVGASLLASASLSLGLSVLKVWAGG